MFFWLKPVTKGELKKVSIVAHIVLLDVAVLKELYIEALVVLPLPMSLYSNHSGSAPSAPIDLIFIAAHATHYIHSVLIEPLNVAFIEVDNVELDNSASFSVGMPVSLLAIALPAASDFEVEPERASFGVCIHLHEEVVLIFIHYIGRI